MTHLFVSQLGRQSLLEAELSSVTLKLQLMEAEKRSLQRNAEDQTAKVRPKPKPTGSAAGIRLWSGSLIWVCDPVL